MVAPVEEVVNETLWAVAYVPAAGVKLGAAKAGAAVTVKVVEEVALCPELSERVITSVSVPAAAAASAWRVKFPLRVHVVSLGRKRSVGKVMFAESPGVDVPTRIRGLMLCPEVQEKAPETATGLPPATTGPETAIGVVTRTG